jgi:hypothetical protein
MGMPVWARVACFFGTLVAISVSKAAPDTPLPETIEFNRDVRPILSDKCYTCHGPGKQMANLRFDREESAKQALRSGGSAIVPKDPANSKMLQRVRSTNRANRMPLGGEALSERDVAVLDRWIAQGAGWEKHWSFIPPKRPDIPRVKESSLAKNAIDNFVLQRLDREGMKFSPEAERATLIRRVTLDLTGVPPTPAEVDAFVADKSPNAYEKVVDRLLKSSRYGERMAYPWLDAARYADTNGYQSDGERYMWRWRDWVIDAFNSNMPYDRFIVEQLAGDLLPNATLNQKIATGFNRNHRGNAEGGIVPEEYAAEYVIDRVDTTATAFLGMTFGCSRCHDHKYDPITQKDYYSLFAYFNNIPESGKARRIGNSPPFIKAPTQEQAAQLKQLEARVTETAQDFQKLDSELVKTQLAWESSLDKSKPLAWGPARGLVAHYSFDNGLRAEVSLAPDGKLGELKAQDGDSQFATGRMGQAASFDGKRFIQTTDVTGFGSHGSYDDKYTIAAWIYPTAATGAIVTKTQDVIEPHGHGLNLADGKIQYNYVNKWLDDCIRLQTEKTVSLNEWHQVTLTYDGSRAADGVKIYVDGEPWKLEIIVDDLNFRFPLRREPLRIGAGGGTDNRFKGSIDEVRVYDRALTPAEIAVLADSTPVTQIATIESGKRTATQASKIRDYYLENAAPQNIRQAWNQLLDATQRRDQFSEGLPTVMVMEEMATPRESHVLLRGSYDRPGDKVTPALPGFLASASNFPPNRLGLAQWLVDSSNPLTARVAVNRFWQMYFGTGIVKTTEDFGSQGDAPSHPELLDWLATEFVRTGWDVKALQKTIVMSATYRQSSRIAPDALQSDPENRLLARGPLNRLSPEMVRDQALAVAGLLVDKIGGASVRPYQPDGLWKEVNSGEEYTQEHGENLYRRSLYTFWKRSVPPPTMANFDASNRESCVVRKGLTNTPLQALDLMNDVTYLEAARVLGQRMMREGGSTPAQRIEFAFRLATARPPKAGQADILQRAFAYQLDSFKGRKDAAAKFVKQGEAPQDASLDASELAAYTTVASLILNLNEAITKE